MEQITEDNKNRIEGYHQNICIIPFIHLASRADGVVQLCCRALKILGTSEKPLSLGRHSLDEIWNGPEMRQIRLSMLKGEKLPECQNCWSEEKNRKRSKRVKENKKFLKSNIFQLKEATDNNGILSSTPFYIELKSGNLCNLKCRTCNPLASSLWRTELKHNEKKWIQEPVMKDTYQGIFHVSKQMSKWHETDIFFQTVKEMEPDLKYISMTGGEPLLIKSNRLVMEYLLNTGAYRNITLDINSNMTRWVPSFFKKISQFKAVDFFVSVDAVGEKNDWIRTPSRFLEIEKNMERLLQLSDNVKVHIICTVSAYNVFYIHELIEWSRYLAKKLKVPAPPVYFNMLHQPKFQHISVLTRSLKQKVIELCNNMMKMNLYQLEREGVSYIINFLQSSLDDTEEVTHLRMLLKKHTEILDEWRNEKFSSVFPELVELWH